MGDPPGQQRRASGSFYRSVLRRESLRPFVESLWIQEAPTKVGGKRDTTLVLPTGSPELILFYGDPFVRMVGSAPMREPTLAFGGQRTGPLRVAATGKTGILIVRFHPWGAAPLLRQPMASLRDRCVALDDLTDAGGSSGLEERLMNDARDWRERVRLLERFLERQLWHRPLDPLAVHGIVALVRSRGTLEVNRLARQLGVSRRHLSRAFAASVGLSPKRFAALTRFQQSLRHLRSAMAWSDVAAASGYHDQAHLIRTWRKLAGEAPGRLLRRQRPTRLGEFFNDAARSHSYNTTYL